MPVAVSLPMNDKVLMRASFHHVQKGVFLCMGANVEHYAENES